MHPSLPDESALRIAIATLLEGGLVAFPTETVYGLGADADRADAVAAIFRIKGRPANHPLILHVRDTAALAQWAHDIPAEAQALATRFWPGPLTLVLPRSGRASDTVTGGQDTVGLRCPLHPWAQSLLQALATARRDPHVALAAPSANRYGRISPTSAAHVRADFGASPASGIGFILDGGPSTLGIESTIVDFASGRVRVLRPGSITTEQLQAVVGAPVARAGEAEAAPRTSGRVVGHYAPRKPLELVDPGVLAQRMRELQELRGLRVGVLARTETGSDRNSAGESVAEGDARTIVKSTWISAPASPEEYARLLYEHLRRLDASEAQCLLVATPPDGSAWEAIHDRLRRAAAGSTGALDDAD